jgi:hypothetical protein
MEEMCNLLRIPYHKVSKENHCAILVEHFHWYLNEVQTINSAHIQDLTQWIYLLFLLGMLPQSMVLILFNPS